MVPRLWFRGILFIFHLLSIIQFYIGIKVLELELGPNLGSSLMFEPNLRLVVNKRKGQSSSSFIHSFQQREENNAWRKYNALFSSLSWNPMNEWWMLVVSYNVVKQSKDSLKCQLEESSTCYVSYTFLPVTLILS